MNRRFPDLHDDATATPVPARVSARPSRAGDGVGAGAVAAAAAAAPLRVRLGACVVHLDTRQVGRGGVWVQPRPKVFDLIALLLRHRPAAVPRDVILDTLWASGAGSPASLAHTVQDARRVLGDDSGNPQWLLTVRGVGYRLAAEPATAPGHQPGPQRAHVDAVQALLRDVRRGLDTQPGGPALRRLAVQALALAELHQLPSERAQALACCAWLSAQDGELALAARQATQALAGVSPESDPATWALATLGQARAHLAAGDIAAVLNALTALHPALHPALQPALRDLQDLGTRYWCEHLLASAHLGLEAFDDARQWWERAHDTALAAGLFPSAQQALAHTAEVELHHGDALQRAGDTAQARTRWQRGLQATARVLQLGKPRADALSSCEAITLRAHLSLRLGEVDAARALFAAAASLLAEPTDAPSLATLTQQVRLLCGRALLAARTGDAAQGVRCVESAWQLCAHDAAVLLRRDVALVAEEVHERGGQPQAALAWARRVRQITRQVQQHQAAELVAIAQAQTQSVRWRHELEQALQRLGEAMDEAQQLRRQVQALQAQVPQDPTTGLLAPAAWLLSLEGVHLQRRRKGLPLSLVALRIQNLPALQSAHPAPALDWLLRDLRQGLARSEDVGPAIGRWQADLVVLAMPGVGPAVASAAVQDLLSGLDAAHHAGTMPGPGLVLRSAVVDAAAYRNVQEAVAALAQRA